MIKTCKALGLGAMLALPVVANAAPKKPAKPAAPLVDTVTQSAPAKHVQGLHDQFTGQPYGMAGCGLGSIVFGDKPGLVQVVAATVNGTFASQTFGITSGTSNCEDRASTAAFFIDANRVSLASEMARGSGETIANLSRIYGCQDEAAFGHALQSHFTEIFPSSSVQTEQVRSGIEKTIQSDRALAQTCGQVG